MSLFGKHSAIPAWVLPAAAVGAAVIVGTVIALVIRGSRPQSDTPTVVDTATTTTTTTATTTTTTTTAPTTTTTAPPTTTTTTRKKTTIPSVKPPTVPVESGDGVHDRVTTQPTTRATAAHDGYKPVRPDRVCLPDLPHLYGSTGKILGIDVSNHNKDIDWKKVKAAGIRFAMIRCGYRTTVGGEMFEDARYRQNIQGALDAGIEVGVYFFSAARTRQEVLDEAAFTLEAVKGYDITWPIAYDFEIFGMDRLAGVDNATVTDNAITFMDYVAQYGYTPMLYSSRNMLRDSFQTGRLGAYRVWMAQYAELTVKSYAGPHAIWQCASDGLVDGIETWVDLNIAYEDLAQPHEPLLTPTYPDRFEGISFTETWDTVEATGIYNMRRAPLTNTPTIYTTSKKGERFIRTGVDEKNGWARVLYNGETLYITSEALQYIGAAPTTTTTTTTEETTTTTTEVTSNGGNNSGTEETQETQE